MCFMFSFRWPTGLRRSTHLLLVKVVVELLGRNGGLPVGGGASRYFEDFPLAADPAINGRVGIGAEAVICLAVVLDRFFGLAEFVVLRNDSPDGAIDQVRLDARRFVERQVELIRGQNLYGAVHAVFMEEEPRIGDCYRMSRAENFVIVPFFISDGLHSFEEIPVMLGEAQEVVRSRFNNGQPTWRNPTEKNGKLVWYTSAVGSEPRVAEVILERVREAERAGGGEKIGDHFGPGP